MKHLIISFIALHLCIQTLAQTGKWQLAGRVYGEAGEPLAGATVTAGGDRQTSTDSAGAFYLQLENRREALVVRRLGYFPQRIRLDTVAFSGDKARVTIFLVSNDIALPEVAVSGRPVETIYRENNRTSLIDYGFAGKDLLLLVREGKNFFLRLTTDAGAPLAELRLPEDDFTALHQSCIGNFHAVGASRVWEVALNGRQLDTLPPYPAAQFHHVVEPCVLVQDDHYFFRRGGPFRQSVEYFYIDPQYRRHTLVTVKDEAAEQQLLRRYREILAAYMRTIPDIDQDEILAGNSPLTDPVQALKPENLLKMAETNGLIAAIGFFDLLATDSVYAPLVKVGEDICLFDHVNDRLLRFRAAPWEGKEVMINYHRAAGWNKQVLADAVLKRVYGRFSAKNGALVLKEIDLLTGAVRREYEPEIAPYLSDHYKIRNGYLYLIGQPQANEPNRRLYKINLFKFAK